MNFSQDWNHMHPTVVIIGKVPPPVGGVGVHLTRLMEHFTNRGLKFQFIYLRYSNLVSIFRAIIKNRIYHLHTSSPLVRVSFLVVFTLILRARSIVTYHGNLGRFGWFYNLLDVLSVRIANIPIVLNNDSYIKALKYNKATIKLGAFVKPAKFVPDPTIENKINKFLKFGFRASFCTNAYGMSFDISGSEIYGISFLLDFFKLHPDLALCISDPSGQYINYFKLKNLPIPNNVLIFGFSHDFLTVLSCCDCFIRATTTDGDSLSIGEALFLSKKVIASDCVSRSSGVVLYRTGDAKDFESKIFKVVDLQSQSQSHSIVDSIFTDTVEELLFIYKSIMV